MPRLYCAAYRASNKLFAYIRNAFAIWMFEVQGSYHLIQVHLRSDDSSDPRNPGIACASQLRGKTFTLRIPIMILDDFRRGEVYVFSFRPFLSFWWCTSPVERVLWVPVIALNILNPSLLYLHKKGISCFSLGFCFLAFWDRIRFFESQSSISVSSGEKRPLQCALWDACIVGLPLPKPQKKPNVEWHNTESDNFGGFWFILSGTILDFLKECHVLNQDLSFLCSFGAAIDVPVLGGIHSGVEEAKGSENLDSNRVGSNNSNSLEMSRDV